MLLASEQTASSLRIRPVTATYSDLEDDEFSLGLEKFIIGV
jgi:hypothetical protein